MIVFINCGFIKTNKDEIAEKMYIGDTFKKSLKYAKNLPASHIYILSAKYGLLELYDKISPYNKTLNNSTDYELKNWSKFVYWQLKQKKVDFEEEAIFLCSKNYRKFVMRFFQNAKCPIAGMRIGELRHFYSVHRGDEK